MTASMTCDSAPQGQPKPQAYQAIVADIAKPREDLVRWPYSE